jgi:anti-sigma regulatory factor (Ser/Thr protein kinase)
VRDARAFVRTCCQAAGTDGDACETAVLLTSETVTNAFVHGRSEARLAVTARVDGLLVEVGDDNFRPPQLVEQDPDAMSGRGLVILDMLATSWGVSDHRPGKTVWFEVRSGPHA